MVHIYYPAILPKALIHQIMHHFYQQPYGSFQKSGVLLVGVLITRALLFGVYVRAPDLWKPPYYGMNGSWAAVPEDCNESAASGEEALHVPKILSRRATVASLAIGSPRTAA